MKSKTVVSKSIAVQLSLVAFTTLMTLGSSFFVKPVQAATITLGNGALTNGDPNNPIAVDLELSLLVDVSGSINANEFNLQKQGYVNAFKDITLWSAISGGPIGKIAVNLIYWSSTTLQTQAVGWTLIDSLAAAQSFANAINATSRPFGGGTAPGAAITYATPLFGTETGSVQNGFNSTRQVIDVSGDGTGETSTSVARNAALAKGIDAINGLPILANDQSLLNWYSNNIKGGNGAFVIAASTFDTFEQAVKQKLVREITPTPPTSVPEPSSLLGLAFLGGTAFSLRRQLTGKKVEAEA
ncbi:MAG: DUF1194 domain-containing protein [Leptolyngbyaceae cyanobacterium bins.59]|nr:DUF1194 domain-containing protein [Leptolyngbyaceae cyanobacterium bins.59]